MKALTEALRSAIHAKQTAPQPSPAPKVEQEKNESSSGLDSIKNLVDFSLPLREARDQFERLYFTHLLEQERYSMTRVAAKAQLERTHLYRKLRQLGIEWSKDEP